MLVDFFRGINGSALLNLEAKREKKESVNTVSKEVQRAYNSKNFE